MKKILLATFVFLLLPVATYATDHSQEQELDDVVTQVLTQTHADDNDINRNAMKRKIIFLAKNVSDKTGQNVTYSVALRIYLCSLQAAHPDDPGRIIGTGIPFAKINSEHAIGACLDAYQHGGNQFGVVVATLSRAYNKAEQYDQSFKYAREAVALGYPFGDVMMAIHYEYGDGVEKSKEKQFLWYEKAAQKGVTSAMRSTSWNYLKAKGTDRDIDKARHWALAAIDKKDGKAFYQLGQVLEATGRNKPNAGAFKALAKETYEIAAANGVDVRKDIARTTNSDRYLRQDLGQVWPTPVYRRNPGESSRALDKWYIGHKIIYPHELIDKIQGRPTPQDREKIAYAVLWHQVKSSLDHEYTFRYESTFIIWYWHDPDGEDTGWYVDFLYDGGSDIASFNGLAVFPKGSNTQTVLDIADPGVEKSEPLLLHFRGPRLTARLSFRDVLLLENGEYAGLTFVKAGQKNLSGYNIPLNNEKNISDPAHTAKSVLAKLIDTARSFDSDCCKGPVILPFSHAYFSLFESCRQEKMDKARKGRWINQNCADMLKNVRISQNRFGASMDSSIANLLSDIKALTGP